MFFLSKLIKKVIIVFYPSLKLKVKMISVNMKSGTLKMIFLAISLYIKTNNLTTIWSIVKEALKKRIF